MVKKSTNANLAKGRGKLPSRSDLYLMVAQSAKPCIKYLVDVVNNEQPANAVRMGAARILLNKVLPDLKVTEHQGDAEKLQMGVVILPTLKDEPKVDTSKLDEPSISMDPASGAANTSTPAKGV